MRTFVPLTLLLISGSALILGCGGSNAGSIPAAKQPVVASNPAPAAAPSTPAAPANSTPAAPKSKSKSGDKKSRVPENADPKTVYIVASIGHPMDVTATNGLIPSIQYQVAYADPKSNSTNYSLESIGVPTQAQSLVGRGTPKAGFTLPKGFVEYKQAGYDASGLPQRIVCTKTDTMLALVPEGPSIVGTDDGPEESQPIFNVMVDAFYMEIMEVSADAYEKYRAELKEKKKPTAPPSSNPNAGATMPALGVPWAGAQGYLRWAGMELPTEAEFEKAARGPKGLRTPWGDGKPLTKFKGVTKIGKNREDTSPYGIMDLATNAKEWCADLYSPTAHNEALQASNKDVLHNWAGPKRVRDSNLRVVKGDGPDWSVWGREGLDMQKLHTDIGFRGVLRLKSESNDAKESKDPKESKPNSKPKNSSSSGF